MLLVMGAASLLAGIPVSYPSPRSSSALKGLYPCHTLPSLPALWLRRPGRGSASLPVAFGWVSEAESACLAATQALGRSSGGAAGLLSFSWSWHSGDEMRSDETVWMKHSHSPTTPLRFPG